MEWQVVFLVVVYALAVTVTVAILALINNFGVVWVEDTPFTNRDAATVIRYALYPYDNTPQGARYWETIEKNLGGAREDSSFHRKRRKSAASMGYRNLYLRIVEPFLSERELNEFKRAM